MIRFTYPQYLWLLPLAWAFTWWVLRGSLADLGRARSALAAIVRAILLSLLILAIAGMQFVHPTKSLCTVFVVDVSDSIAPAQQRAVLNYIDTVQHDMRTGDRFALVAFGAEALLDHAPDSRAKMTRIVSLPGSARTDIAAGIQLAMASFPQDTGKQIVLFSDGNENLGNAADQADLALANNVHISVVPLTRDTSRGEALLLQTDIPAEVKQGAPFEVSVVAESQQETDGTIALYRNNQPVEARKVHLNAGKTVVAFEQSAPAGGLYQYRATLALPPGHDTIPDNNVSYAYTHVAGKPHVLIVEENPGDGQFLARALQANDLIVEVGGPDRIPATLQDCAQYDGIVFANIPAWHMSPTQMTIIRDAVRDTGMGFAMIGGDNSFGAGGYYQTPVEEALPVTMDMKKQKQLPSLALVIVIDVSGSMTASEDGVMKIKLAAEAAIAATKVLQPVDQICVIGYDNPDSFVYTVPMTRADNKSKIVAQIERLQPGGEGIFGYSALKEAYKAIHGTHAQIKHILFCADAADDHEPTGAVEFARQMHKEKISLSTIGFGTRYDQYWSHYQEMARAGGGNAYLAERLSNLPQIFSRDILFTAKPLLIEKPFLPRPGETDHPIMRGIDWANEPPLLGYVATSLKETPSVHTLLSSPTNDPVLAAWPYGLGRSVAFTSDATAHWAAHWLGWPAYAPFWAQSLRWMLRQGGTANFSTRVTENNGRATVAVDAITGTGEYRNLLDLRANISHVSPGIMLGPQVAREEVELSQTAPGHYEGNFETRDTGTYVVTVVERENAAVKSMQTSTLVIPYSPEFQTIGTNTALLSDIAERGRGAVDPQPTDIFGRLRVGSRTLHDLWPLLLCVLAAFFLIDVAVRRILLPWDELCEMTWQGIRKRLPHWQFAGAAARQQHVPTMDALLTVKGKTRRNAGRFDELSSQTPTEQTSTLIPPPGVPESPPTPAPPVTSTASTTSSLLKKKREREGKE